MKKMITTHELAQVLKLCDKYLIDRYHTSIDQIMELNIDNKGEYILILLQADKEINNFLEKYNLFDIIYEMLDEYSKKKIFTISDETLRLSTKRPNDLTETEYRITEDRLNKIFKSLEHNMELYDRLYRDKIWIIDSSIGRSEKISISPTRFFHLMGLDEKDFKDEESMRVFESIFPEDDSIRSLMRDRKDLFKVLEKMLQRETSIKESILDGTLKPVINPKKLEMKAYSFERIGIIEHSSGMIFYDKELAQRLGHNTRLQTDLILLSNFIRKYNLEFIFSMYKRYKHTPKAKDAESLIIPQRGYENSEFIEGQQVSISESARRYSAKDFEYNIREESESEEPLLDPEEYIVFSDEDKARMANSIITGLPSLDSDHLRELYEMLKKGIEERKNIRNNK
ncbi:MAG: hypothetical protein J5970_01395 [Bacilli bacterium]|nr:hypothetical protein [Bacilli bacterium]MBO6243979.1 hypothetical protein [Clostridia bacterium]